MWLSKIRKREKIWSLGKQKFLRPEEVLFRSSNLKEKETIERACVREREREATFT